MDRSRRRETQERTVRLRYRLYCSIAAGTDKNMIRLLRNMRQSESIAALQAAADSTDGLENLTDLQTLPPVDISQIDLTGITDCTKRF